MNNLYTWGMVAVIVAVTALTRFFPFIVFRGDRKTPAWIERLGRSLPYAMMGMLVVYCFKNGPLVEGSNGLPEIIASAVTLGLQAWRKNMAVSIAGGTLCYMGLVQFIFC